MKTVCKLRDIARNCKSSQLLNFETIKVLILNGRLNSTVTVRTDKKNKRNRIDGACVSIVRDPEEKTIEYLF